MNFESRKILLMYLMVAFVVYLIGFLFPGELSPELVNSHPELFTQSTQEIENQTETMTENTDQRSILTNYNLDAASAENFKLAKSLQEISGLATTGDDRLLAHNDERGSVYQLSMTDGAITKSFSLSNGGGMLKDDFEGIAVGERNLYMTNSAGKIYEFQEGADQEAVPFVTYQTSTGADCEIEGLAYQATTKNLLIMCKNPRSSGMRNHLAIFQWSTETKALLESETIRIPIKSFADKLGSKKFQPSGIEWHAESGHYLIVAARQQAIAEVSPTGEVLHVQKLDGKWHRQMEGITLAANGDLLVSDEGAGKSARLTRYSLN